MAVTIILAVLTVLYVFLLVRYLRVAYVDELRFRPGEYGAAPDRAAFRRSTRAKLSLSVLFCVIGAIGLCVTAAQEGIAAGGVCVLAGLVCVVFGDYYLQFIRADAKKFNLGILFFALTQAFLLASLFLQQAIGWAEIVAAVVILMLVLALMKKQNWQLGKAQGPLTVYTVLLVLMAVKAVTVVLTSPDGNVGNGPFVFAAGAVLFLLSDLLLGIWNFHSNRRMDANLNWITYFAGTLLIALSLSVN